MISNVSLNRNRKYHNFFLSFAICRNSSEMNTTEEKKKKSLSLMMMNLRVSVSRPRCVIVRKFNLMKS